MSTKIIKKVKSYNTYDETYHVAYNASLSKNKQNKMLKNNNNPNEWIFEFLEKLKPQYNSEDFSTNLPFMPPTLDQYEKKNALVKKTTKEIKVILTKNNIKQRLTADEIQNKLKLKKEENENKILLQKIKQNTLLEKKKNNLTLKTQSEFINEVNKKNLLNKIDNKKNNKIKENELSIIDKNNKLNKLNKSRDEFTSLYDYDYYNENDE